MLFKLWCVTYSYEKAYMAPTLTRDRVVTASCSRTAAQQHVSVCRHCTAFTMCSFKLSEPPQCEGQAPPTDIAPHTH